MGSSCSSTKDQSAVLQKNPLLVQKSKTHPAEIDAFEQASEEKSSAILISKDEDLKLPERDQKYIFDIELKKLPLGIVITSAKDGTSAYVTKVHKKKNKSLRKGKLPLNSKLLKVNGTNIEKDGINKIIDSILKEVKHLPLTLTFCHPDGLRDYEIADPNPKVDHTRDQL